jgi:hypothetical protein
MKTARVLYFKKKRDAWVAQSPEGKIFLPQCAVRIHDEGTLREVRPAEPRPKPKADDTVFFVPAAMPGQAAEWALA